jgi:hypothetical protein
VSLSGRSCWSWTALAAWLADAALAITLAAGLLFGPEMADRAWDNGIHVTPAQAAMHAAFLASGLAHHHSHTTLPAGQAAAPIPEGASLQPDATGTTWGTPFTPTARRDLPGCPAFTTCTILPADQIVPGTVDPAPPVPPPD